jgi:hypothetical protein
VFKPLTAPYAVPPPVIKDARGHDVAKEWKDFPPEEVRDALPNWYSTSATYVGSATGGLEYFAAGVTGQAGEYQWTWDEGRIRNTADEIDPQTKVRTARKEGIAWRVKAQVKTSRAAVSLANLEGLSAAFKAGWLTGRMEVETWGVILTGPAPAARDITEENIKALRKEIQKINTDVGDGKLKLIPHVLAVRTEGSASSEVTSARTMDSGRAWFSSTSGPFRGATKYPNTPVEETDIYRIPVLFNTTFSQPPSVSVSISGLSLPKGAERFEVRAANVSVKGFDLEMQHWNQTPVPEVIVVLWQAVNDGERTSTAARHGPIRLGTAHGTKFTAPVAGWIYAQCGNGHSCEVLLEADRSITTGKLESNQSGMFPISEGQVALVDSVGGSNPSAQVIIHFFGGR